jgi:hypothetical protein
MSSRNVILSLFVCFVAVTAWAGAPLKGVDVKLGRNPGGTPAARTTNAEGKIDLGVLAAGSYYVIIDTPKSVHEAEADIESRGAAGGTVKKRWNFAQKRAFAVGSATRDAGADKIIVTSDGKHPITIAATTIVKSKSNISNN